MANEIRTMKVLVACGALALTLHGCSQADSTNTSSTQSSLATVTTTETAATETVSNETVTGTTLPAPIAQAPYERISPDTYDVGQENQETAVFTSGDGTSVHCSFSAVSGQFNFPQKMFLIDETAGQCSTRDKQWDINTDENVQVEVAILRSDPPVELPEASATVDTGEMVHLGHLGCWAPTAAEVNCLDFASEQAFNLSAAGLREMSPVEVTAQLTDASGRIQALSTITTFAVNDGQEVTCRGEVEGQEFHCYNDVPAGWTATEGQGPANTLSWNLADTNAEFLGARGTNPAMDLYESRQVLEPGSYLLAGGVLAESDGNTLTLTTPQGHEFWLDSQAYGAGEKPQVPAG